VIFFPQNVGLPIVLIFLSSNHVKAIPKPSGLEDATQSMRASLGRSMYAPAIRLSPHPTIPPAKAPIADAKVLLKDETTGSSCTGQEPLDNSPDCTPIPAGSQGKSVKILAIRPENGVVIGEGSITKSRWMRMHVQNAPVPATKGLSCLAAMPLPGRWRATGYKPVPRGRRANLSSVGG